MRALARFRWLVGGLGVLLLLGLASCKRDVTDEEQLLLSELHRAVALIETVISSLPQQQGDEEKEEKKKKEEASELEVLARRVWEQLVLARNEYGAALLADTAGDSAMADLLLDSVKLALKAALVELKQLRRALAELEPTPIASLAMLDEIEKIALSVLKALKKG